MLALLDTNQDLDQCGEEIGGSIGQLLTPLTRRALRDVHAPWAIDNGAFAGFNEKLFTNLLALHFESREKCLFLTVPDVVGSARRTLEVFERWAPRLAGWRLAIACQDGQEHLPIPWDAIDAVFIGGSTNWKCSEHVVQIIRAAQALGKWVHVGRVNTPMRWAHFEDMGVDSADGTGIARYTHMREEIANRHQQQDIFA